ncbi:MAG: glycosyltransferase [Muribaculum sp.]|nr:glycosyltransferase [Muribaculum sp.]
MQQQENRKPYISIVIPVYNVEPYLEKCLNSVLGQNYQDFECILVDDGSTDKSGKICDRFASADPRVTVVHKSNGGLVSARKAGLQKAAGEFIGCVDSDDWVEEDYFEKMVEMQQKTGADIVAGNHFRDVGSESYPIFNNIPIGLYSREDILPKLIYAGKFFEFSVHPSLCTKLIRKRIVDTTQMSVNEDIVSDEDGAVLYPSVLEADTVVITDICGYHYVQRQGSISKSECPDDLRRLRLVFDHVEKAFASKGLLEDLKFQMMQWQKYVYLERHIQVFDDQTSGDTILQPYGGIPLHSRIVVYGGSALGQTIVRYISGDHLAENVLWIDQAYENFQKQGLPMFPPEDIRKLENQYDYVLLASVTERIVASMKRCLLDLQVPEDKIVWLSEDFIDGDVNIHDGQSGHSHKEGI